MNRLIFILLLFGSVGFFNYHNILPEAAIRAIICALIVMSLVMGLTERNSSLRDVNYPRALYWGVIGLMLFSIPVGTIFSGQPMLVSIKTSIAYILTYLYFYALMRQRIAPSMMLRWIGAFCVCSCIVYFVNAKTFPYNIFGEPLLDDFSRGIPRIPVVGMELMLLLMFYAIGRWQDDNKIKWWAIIATVMIMAVLSVVRQVIALSLLLGLWMLMRRYTLGKKLLVVAVVAIGAAIIVPRLPMYKAMTELTEDQADDNANKKEDIRITAWRYYTYEQWDNPMVMLFGHSVPSFAGDSDYGNRVQAEIEINKCYAFDVGWAGFSHYFGVLGAFLLLLMFIVTIMHCRHYQSKEYLVFWFSYIIITSIASAPIMYHQPVLYIAIGLYLAYCPEDDLHYDSEHYYEPQLTD